MTDWIWDPFNREFMSSSWKSCENSPCFCYDSNDPIRSQICTCDDSWSVVTCASLWSDCYDRIIVVQVRVIWIAKYWIMTSKALCAMDPFAVEMSHPEGPHPTGIPLAGKVLGKKWRIRLPKMDMWFHYHQAVVYELQNKRTVSEFIM